MYKERLSAIRGGITLDIIELCQFKGVYSDMLEVYTIYVLDDVTICINSKDYLVKEVCVDGVVIPGKGVVGFDRLGLESDLLPLLEYLEGL